MKYEQLNKIFYKDNKNYKKFYKNRFDSESSYHLNFKIGENQAFYVVTNEMLNLALEIQGTVQKIVAVNNSVPPVAQHFFTVSCLIDEMDFTNQFEGVRSSRRELKEALDVSESKNKKEHVRFLGLVDKYSKMNDELQLSTCEDVRALYDQLILPEIEKEEDKPDGKIFRKESVSVMSATQKEAHRGLLPEDKIIEAMDAALKTLQQDDIHILIRICIFHYLFGYIHPFYDGNGRISRFISSYYLWHHINQLLAYRLSYTVVSMRKEYEAAFDDCNNSNNKGDITPFILSFLNIIKTAAVDLYDHLEYSVQKLEYYYTLEDELDLTKDENTMLAVFIQNAMFSFEPLDKETLIGVMKFKNTKISNLLKSLVDKKIPIILSKEGHKNVYSLELDKFEQYCEDK